MISPTNSASMLLIMKVNLCVDGGVMEKYKSNQWLHYSPFSLWNIRPWVCVIDSKRHIRTFLRDALEEFDFITSECASDIELSGTLAAPRYRCSRAIGRSRGRLSNADNTRSKRLRWQSSDTWSPNNHAGSDTTIRTRAWPSNATCRADAI